MSFFSIPKMVTNYNNAIETCEIDPLSEDASSNKVICGLETMMQQSISSRLEKKNRILENLSLSYLKNLSKQKIKNKAFFENLKKNNFKLVFYGATHMLNTFLNINKIEEKPKYILKG